MLWFLIILVGLPFGGLLFWWWARRRLLGLRRPQTFRTMLAIFCAGQLGLFVALLATRRMGWHHALPAPLIAVVYVWHLFILPLTAAMLMPAYALGAVSRLIAAGRAGRSVTEPDPPAGTSPPPAPTRRQFLAAAAAALPPLAAVGTTSYGLWQVHGFEVTPLPLAIPGLPPALEGLRIAHVSDTHVGRFTTGRDLDRITERVNALDADLVLFTGDLIDHTLADLPDALAMARLWRARHGVFFCEGNHDLFEGREEFEDGVRNAGLRLLLNEAPLIRINGQDVQIMGIKWGGSGPARRTAMLQQHTTQTLALTRTGAFPILLAHHPHAFDLAAAAGIPLTLSGHTHGGQLMLTRHFGPGPLMYKYWSGLYQQGQSSLVVSNGVGNWFPLRINAPAQIMDIRLGRAPRNTPSSVSWTA